jgi:hypothetical protein
MLKDPEIRNFIVHAIIFFTMIFMIMVAVFHGIPEDTKQIYWAVVLGFATMLDIKPIIGSSKKNTQEQEK